MKEMLQNTRPSDNSTNFLFQVGNWKNGDSSLLDKTEKDLFLCSGVNACLCACFKHAQTHFTCNKDAF